MTQIFSLLVSASLLVSMGCSKSVSSKNDVSINQVAGNYGGGILTWRDYSIGSRGIDSNYHAIVEFVEPEKIKVTLLTNAPLPFKILEFKVAYRDQDDQMGYYEFIDGEPDAWECQASFNVFADKSASNDFALIYCKKKAFQDWTSASGTLYKQPGISEQVSIPK